MFNEERLKTLCANMRTKLRMLVQEVEVAEYTDTQWYLDFEDELNELSTKDHKC